MIREASINDAGSIAKIIVAAWQNAYTGIIDPEIPRKMTEDKFISIMTDNINNKSEDIFVYESDNSVHGFISGKINSGHYDCEVIGLYIDPEHQGRGIGSELLDKMKSFYRNKNCRNMIIHTLLNAKNNSFYKKYKGVPGKTDEIELGNKKYPGIYFAFQL